MTKAGPLGDAVYDRGSRAHHARTSWYGRDARGREKCSRSRAGAGYDQGSTVAVLVSRQLRSALGEAWVQRSRWCRE